MLEVLFTIVVAGCGHDSRSCEVVSTSQVAATSVESCERQLDSVLAETMADWPVTAAVCRPGDMVTLPDGWSFPNLSIASAPAPGNL